MPTTIIVCDCAKKRKVDSEVEKAIKFQEDQLGKNRRYANTMQKGGAKCTICNEIIR